jgi:hypothetical protein
MKRRYGFLKQPVVQRLRPTGCLKLNGIQNTICQYLPDWFLILLPKHVSSQEKYFSATQHKEAKCITVPKAGKDDASPRNYIPVTLLNSLGKQRIHEKIILKVLNF